MRLQGRRAIVTGCSRGLGTAIASAMHAEGAELLLVARSTQGLAAVQRTLLDNNPNGGRIHTLAADLSDPTSPQAITSEARKIWPRIDVLVNNAGIIGPMGQVDDNNWTQWRETIQVNLLAPAELCQLSIRWMRETGSGGSIINLSGGGAASPRPRFSAYGTSKCALVRFGETIAAEVAHLGIRVNSIAPGAMNTDMLHQTLKAGPDSVGHDEYQRIAKFSTTGGADPRTAANLTVYLASDSAAGVTGKLISAVWDRWEQIHEHEAVLRNSDIYTLRRIVPEDRGENWTNA